MRSHGTAAKIRVSSSFIQVKHNADAMFQITNLCSLENNPLGGDAFRQAVVVPTTMKQIMEVDNPLFVEENSVPGGPLP